MSVDAGQSNSFTTHRDPRPKPSFLQLTVVIWLIVIFLAEAAASGITWPTIMQRLRSLSFTTSSPSPPIIGHAYFVSSRLVIPETNQGITDELQINLGNIPPAQSGKSYYAWLLNDKTLDWNPIFLGQLDFKNGTLSLFYPGDALHSNLLATNSRFLITEEKALTAPTSPSLDPGTWVYYAEFSQQKPVPTDPKSYSLYDHIRTLLADDPKVKAAGLIGGLDNWLFSNTQKILVWADGARDYLQYENTGSSAIIHRQLVRIMDYLDGTAYVQKDIPGQSILADPTISKIGLLTFDPQVQDPPGYLYNIGQHLHEIVALPATSATQKALAIQINQAINGVNLWLRAIHDDVLKLYAMSDAQLFGQDGRALLDEIATLANYAFAGLVDPHDQVTDGVVQIHYDIQRLATFDIRACSASHPCSIK
jgi:eukaryotic-like serine/threonine-protein kinase